MIYAVCFVLGAVIGSFLNVVIYRLPRENLKLWEPPYSFCPVCGHKLSWKDNIPILSYLLLRGRCRYCGARIPLRYLLVEVLTASSFVLSAVLSNDILTMISLCGIFSSLIAISFMDLEVMGIHDSLNVSLFVFSLLFAWRTGNLPMGFMSSLIGIGIFSIFAFLKKGMGSGDVLMIGAGGVALDLLGLDIAILVSAIGGILYSLIKHRGLKMKESIPFGPFLSIGIAVGILMRLIL